MVLLSIFQTTEFYVIVCVIAAAIVALCALPERKSEVRTFLYAGELHSHTLNSIGETDLMPETRVSLACRDDGAVVLHRHGLTGIYSSGAFSIAVKISGFDVTIEERLTPGIISDSPVTDAEVIIDCLAQERYHIQYRSESIGRTAACTLNIRPGNKIERVLS